jgi:hypothetical protein
MTLAEILHFIVDGLSATAPVREKLHAAVDALEADVAKPKTAAKLAVAVPPPLTAEQRAYYSLPAEAAAAPAPTEAGSLVPTEVGTGPLTVDDEIGELEARLAALKAQCSTA